MDKIRAAFKVYFEGWEIELPDPIPPEGRIEKGGWSIRYRLAKDKKKEVCLDFWAENRMTNPRHVRILRSGEEVGLDSWAEGYAYDPKVEGAKDAAEADFHTRNSAVGKKLKKKGQL